MKKRKEVEENIRQHDLDYKDAEMLRLLLDIRDLLAYLPMEMAESPMSDKQYHDLFNPES